VEWHIVALRHRFPGVTDSDDTILSTPERPGWESRARYRPQREETIITWRGSHGRLTDQEHLPLCRLRYLGSDTDGGSGDRQDTAPSAAPSVSSC
jgi:hypothetical protein